MADVLLRDARDNDLDAVAGLLLSAYRQYQVALPEALWAGYHDELGDVRGRQQVAELIVAEREGRLVGSVTFYPDATLDTHGWPEGWAAFRLLAVPPEERGHAVGLLLVDECIRRSRARGARHLGLHTAPFMVAAVSLYERLGFERAPAHDFDAAAHYATDPLATPVAGLAYHLDLGQ